MQEQISIVYISAAYDAHVHSVCTLFLCLCLLLSAVLLFDVICHFRFHNTVEGNLLKAVKF